MSTSIGLVLNICVLLFCARSYYTSTIARRVQTVKIHVSIIFHLSRHVYNIANVQCGFLLDRQTTATNDVVV